MRHWSATRDGNCDRALGRQLQPRPRPALTPARLVTPVPTTNTRSSTSEAPCGTPSAVANTVAGPWFRPAYGHLVLDLANTLPFVLSTTKAFSARMALDERARGPAAVSRLSLHAVARQ